MGHAVVVSTKVAIATQTVRSGDASGLPFILEFSLDLPPMGYLSFVLQRGSSANDRKLALNDEAEPATYSQFSPMMPSVGHWPDA